MRGLLIMVTIIYVYLITAVSSPQIWFVLRVRQVTNSNIGRN
jgi:hypothetical protein